MFADKSGHRRRIPEDNLHPILIAGAAAQPMGISPPAEAERTNAPRVPDRGEGEAALAIEAFSAVFRQVSEEHIRTPNGAPMPEATPAASEAEKDTAPADGKSPKAQDQLAEILPEKPAPVAKAGTNLLQTTEPRLLSSTRSVEGIEGKASGSALRNLTAAEGHSNTIQNTAEGDVPAPLPKPANPANAILSTAPTSQPLPASATQGPSATDRGPYVSAPGTSSSKRPDTLAASGPLVPAKSGPPPTLAAQGESQPVQWAQPSLRAETPSVPRTLTAPSLHAIITSHNPATRPAARRDLIDPPSAISAERPSPGRISRADLKVPMAQLAPTNSGSLTGSGKESPFHLPPAFEAELPVGLRTDAHVQQATSQASTILNRTEMAQHVSRQIAEAIHQLPGRPVEISLSPEELGRVRLAVSSSEAGIVVNVFAERAETIDLMRRHINALETAFTAIGYSDIAFSFAGGSGADQPSDFNERIAGDKDAGPGSETEATGPLTVDLDATRTTGLDLRL
ncbi:flagellar hook-length control protein FliK [Marimonas sp. MJW-29]|uniref:Flagellar hook-length control protein FliK n=1 Tax=Sulfitobacter sediminis TaxID=3234186 RepID=A0ABV3RGP8_9RHOB